jgi:hypothetical protein
VINTENVHNRRREITQEYEDFTSLGGYVHRVHLRTTVEYYENDTLCDVYYIYSTVNSPEYITELEEIDSKNGFGPTTTVTRW